jgi:hypothetical protein
VLAGGVYVRGQLPKLGDVLLWSTLPLTAILLHTFVYRQAINRLYTETAPAMGDAARGAQKHVSSMLPQRSTCQRG